MNLDNLPDSYKFNLELKLDEGPLSCLHKDTSLVAYSGS